MKSVSAIRKENLQLLSSSPRWVTQHSLRVSELNDAFCKALLSIFFSLLRKKRKWRFVRFKSYLPFECCMQWLISVWRIRRNFSHSQIQLKGIERFRFYCSQLSTDMSQDDDVDQRRVDFSSWSRWMSCKCKSERHLNCEWDNCIWGKWTLVFCLINVINNVHLSIDARLNDKILSNNWGANFLSLFIRGWVQCAAFELG